MGKIVPPTKVTYALSRVTAELYCVVNEHSSHLTDVYADGDIGQQDHHAPHTHQNQPHQQPQQDPVVLDHLSGLDFRQTLVSRHLVSLLCHV